MLGAVAPLPGHAAARHPGKRATTPHKAHHALRSARRPRNPEKLIIPQGDGSPVVALAARFLGRPYRFGAEGGAFDCSGFVHSVFAKVGIDLPRSVREQFTRGTRVSRDDLEPGDLVFFRTYAHAPTHVGIYVGEDKFVHAASRGGRVQVDSLNESYFARRYLGARRIET
jgi:cell wall-associated NlpC family hydrolase